MDEASTVHRYDRTTAVTVVAASVVAVAMLLWAHTIPAIVAFPLFLIPVSAYVTVLGVRARHVKRGETSHTYHFIWAAVMMVVGAGWIVLYEGAGPIIGAVVMICIALGYLYLDKAKSSLAVSH
ncbi:MAG: hypothetical protein KGI33_03385 [Thaumarchaeota archaeon]|nr:hypothetical protein [Nitrososphaerota archaeon]